MSLFSSRSPESHARAYCRSIDADPDAEVGGYVVSGIGVGFGQWRAKPDRKWIRQPRWRWYLGATAADPALQTPNR